MTPPLQMELNAITILKEVNEKREGIFTARRKVVDRLKDKRREVATINRKISNPHNGSHRLGFNYDMIALDDLDAWGTWLKIINWTNT